MNNPLEPLHQFLLSGALGALIGFERAIHHKEMQSSYDVGGIRTFTLTSWLGFMAAQMGKFMAGLSLLAFAGFGATILLAYSLHYQERHGITTELAYLGTFGIGFWVGLGEAQMPILAAIGFVTVLGLKEPITALTRKLTQEEVYAAIQFLILAVVVFPLLSSKPLDPWGIMIPRELGLMLVLVSTLGFVGFLIHRFSPKQSPLLLACGAGFLSSTTFIIELVRRARSSQNMEYQETLPALAILSSQMMFLKGPMLLYSLYPELGRNLLLPSLLAFLAGILTLPFLRSRWLRENPEFSSVANPLHLAQLFQFSVVLMALLFLSRLAYRFLGRLGLNLSAFAGGILAMDGITITLAHCASYEIPPSLAEEGIILAWAGNNLFKVIILLLFPGPLRHYAAPVLGSVTLIFYLLTLWL